MLEVNRTAVGETRVVDALSPSIEVGEVRLRIHRFAVTANNVTYAVFGDVLAYWEFFPADLPWGRVPAMGWAEVVESANDGIEVGSRFYGWYPMAAETTAHTGSPMRRCTGRTSTPVTIRSTTLPPTARTVTPCSAVSS